MSSNTRSQAQATMKPSKQSGVTPNRNVQRASLPTRPTGTQTSNTDAAAAVQTPTRTEVSVSAVSADSTPSTVPLETTKLPAPVESANILSLISSDIDNMSPEGKQIVSCIVKAMQIMNNQKDEKITQMQGQITQLENKVIQLENQVDEINQYERRDTIIVGGPALAQENLHENSADVVIRCIKDNLHLNITPSDINVAHRLGSKQSQITKRPIIVKLHSREMKTEIMKACITVKPNLHINESLTPKRRSLFKIVWDIRKQHKDLFQQCYTQDGKIYIKLKNSNLKEIITNDETMGKFLDRHPIFKQYVNSK